MKRTWTPYVQVLFDIVALLVAFRGSFLVGQWISEEWLNWDFMVYSSSQTRYWMGLFLAEALSMLVLFRINNHYRQGTPWWEQVRQIIIICLVLWGLAGFVLFGLKLPFSRLWVSICWLMAMPLLITMRMVARKVNQLLGQWGRQVVVIGGAENTLETMFALSTDTYNRYEVKDIYLLATKKVFAAEALPPSQKRCRQHLTDLASIYDLPELAPGCLVILAPDDNTKIDFERFMVAARKADVEVAFVPPMSGLSLYGMDMQHFFGSHTVLFKPKRAVESRLNRALKRCIDLAGALTGMVVLSVPLLVIMKSIRKDGGPIFYSQERIGMHGKPFRCWKFRSMVPNSAEILEKLLKDDPQARAEWEADFKLKNDPRITKIGHFIRKTSIDELPQLWNVLKGEMSLVGPRPIVAKELEYYGKHQHEYLAAKPGLTGLWQVSGRNDISYAYRVYLDSWYVTHWSIWTDMVIVIKTIGILVNRRGAY